MTRSEHRKKALASVRAQAPALPPDGDWMNVLLIDSGDESIVLEVPPAMAGTENGHLLIASILKQQAIREEGFVGWAVVETVMWHEDGQEGQEAIVVLLGDNETPSDIELHRAFVFRRARKPPHLGPFEQGDPPDAVMAGPIVEAMSGQ